MANFSLFSSNTPAIITIRYSLFTIHYSLFTIHYSLFTIHYSLFVIHYLEELCSSKEETSCAVVLKVGNFGVGERLAG